MGGMGEKDKSNTTVKRYNAITAVLTNRQIRFDMNELINKVLSGRP